MKKFVLLFAALAARHHRAVLAVAFVVVLLQTAHGFKRFLGHIGAFSSPGEWRFYFSLISFLISFSMVVFVVAAFVGIEIYRKRKKM